MKLLLIIDGERQEIPVHAFEISYNKYEEFDTVIIIDTPASIQTTVAEAVGVRKPSGGGIMPWEEDAASITTVASLYENNQSNPLTEARINKGVVVIDKIPDGAVGATMIISSDSIVNDDIRKVLSAVPDACNQLAEREKAAVGDHYLYIEEEPYLKLDENENKYRIIEKVSMVVRKEPVETLESSDK